MDYIFWHVRKCNVSRQFDYCNESAGFLSVLLRIFATGWNRFFEAIVHFAMYPFSLFVSFDQSRICEEGMFQVLLFINIKNLNEISARPLRFQKKQPVSLSFCSYDHDRNFATYATLAKFEYKDIKVVDGQ